MSDAAPRPDAAGPRIASPRSWLKLLAGLCVAFGVFQLMGHVFASDRGQAGIPIALAVCAVLFAAEYLLFGLGPSEAARLLGLGRPKLRGILAAAAASIVLLATIPVSAWANGWTVALSAGWIWMVPGLFAQAGIAEEILFRGYLFRHLSVGRSFWRAAFLSTLPFVGVHLMLFLTLPWPIALASVLLAAVVSIPLAHLFVIGGGTILAPALLHFAIQGGIKIVDIPDEASARLPLIWVAASAIIPFLVLLVRRRSAASRTDGPGPADLKRATAVF